MAGRAGSHWSARLPVSLVRRISDARRQGLTHAASDSEFVRTWIDLVLLSLTGRYGPPSPFDAKVVEKRLRDQQWLTPQNRRRWRRDFPEVPLKRPPKERKLLGPTKGCAITRRQVQLIDAIRQQMVTATSNRTEFVRMCVQYGLEVINRPIYLDGKGDVAVRYD